ncbi:hypothetical protein [Solicola sp. PLA-1-18]|uniref:hypothetical protein n=1 Tax=Solicola sp. PLA-1-18 TaxID=3380532 RepID=UPI003B7E925B
MSELERTWRRYVEVLQVHAPASAASIRPPASPDTRTAAFGEHCLADFELVNEWFSLHDGSTTGDAGQLLPKQWLLSATEAVSYSKIIADGWTHHKPINGPAEAGVSSLTWCPEYLLIAYNSNNDGLFLDLRAGGRHGLAAHWDPVDSDSSLNDGDGNLLPDHLEQLAEAVLSGTPVSGFRPVIANEALSWEFAGVLPGQGSH